MSNLAKRFLDRSRLLESPRARRRWKDLEQRLIPLHDALYEALPTLSHDDDEEAQEIVGGSVRIAAFYRYFLVLPAHLSECFAVLDTLGLSAEDERSLLEELITRGDRSSVYESLRNLWYALGEGMFLWDRKEPIHPGTLLNPDSYGGQHIVEWRDQATWTAFLARHSESTDTLIIRITTELSWLEPLLSDEDRDDLAKYHQNGDIPLETMRRLLNLRLHPRCGEFIALMEEYNWEWALAAVDWEDDGSPTFLEQLQSIVDDSSWSMKEEDDQQGDGDH